MLETVSYWKGDGKKLRALDGDLIDICPQSAGYAQLDPKVVPEISPSAQCRTYIGLVLSTKFRELREIELEAAKAQKKRRTTHRGYLPWNHSLADDYSEGVGTYMPSPSLPPAISATSHPDISSFDTVSDQYSTYEAHAILTSTKSRHNPSNTTSEHEMTRARFNTSLQRDASSSSTDSQRDSQDCSSSTLVTDNTSLPQSPKSTMDGPRKQLCLTTPLPQDGSMFPDEDLLDAISCVRSSVAPSHRSSTRSTGPQKPLTHLQAARRELEMTRPLISRSATRSTHERSVSVPEYGSSIYPASEQFYTRYPSSPSRYRAGVLRTVEGSPPLISRTTDHHSGFSASRDQRSPITPLYSLTNSHARDARQLALDGRQNRVPRDGFVPQRLLSHSSHTPTRMNYVQNASQSPSRLINAPNIHQAFPPRQPIPTVDVFAGRYRSTNIASVDIDTLQDGGKYLEDELRKQAYGITSQMRNRPAYAPPKLDSDRLVVEPSTRIFNPYTRQPFMTLYERLEDVQRWQQRNGQGQLD